MTRVKICGITRASDLRAAACAGADAVGFITDVPVDTPREVTPSEAAELVSKAPPFLTTTLVTMPDSPEHAVELVRLAEPDVIQLHGEFSPEELQFIRAETATKIVAVVDCTDAGRARDYDDVVDAILVDSTADDGAGGTGETHDWKRTRDLADELAVPVILAGGLTPENVAEAVETADPYGVDVASGVELHGGVKDQEAVHEFVRAVRRSCLEAVA